MSAAAVKAECDLYYVNNDVEDIYKRWDALVPEKDFEWLSDCVQMLLGTQLLRSVLALY